VRSIAICSIVEYRNSRTLRCHEPFCSISEAFEVLRGRHSVIAESDFAHAHVTRSHAAAHRAPVSSERQEVVVAAQVAPAGIVRAGRGGLASQGGTVDELLRVSLIVGGFAGPAAPVVAAGSSAWRGRQARTAVSSGHGSERFDTIFRRSCLDSQRLHAHCGGEQTENMVLYGCVHINNCEISRAVSKHADIDLCPHLVSSAC
jgi:hypothetical protein